MCASGVDTAIVLHISDVHFGVETARRRLVCAWPWRKAPEPLICTGDPYRPRHSNDAVRASVSQSLGVTVLCEPQSRHPYFNPWERMTDPFRRYNRLRAAVGSEFVSPDVVLVPLRTTVRIQRRIPWSDGVIRRAAIEDTLARLAALEGDPRTIIVTGHHPLLGPRDDGRNPTIGGDDAFARIAAAGAHAVLSGHVHVPFDEVRARAGHSARMIGAGTLSTRLRHGAPASWRVITCAPGGVIDSELRLVTAPACVT